MAPFLWADLFLNHVICFIDEVVFKYFISPKTNILYESALIRNRDARDERKWYLFIIIA